MSKRGRLIVYSGPSGVGKGTLLAPLIAPGGPLVLSVSATTRAPRPGEVDGIHYHFVSQERFWRMVGEGDMLEYAEYNHHCYGTPRVFVERQRDEGRDVVLEIEVKGAKQVMEKCPDALTVFVMPPSVEALRRRLAARGTETAEQLAGRLAAAACEIEYAKHYDYIIINDEIEPARRRLLSALEASAQLARFHHKLIDEVLQQCSDLR